MSEALKRKKCSHRDDMSKGWMDLRTGGCQKQKRSVQTYIGSGRSTASGHRRPFISTPQPIIPRLENKLWRKPGGCTARFMRVVAEVRPLAWGCLSHCNGWPCTTPDW